jgi:hypothetical protein
LGAAGIHDQQLGSHMEYRSVPAGWLLTVALSVVSLVLSTLIGL